MNHELADIRTALAQPAHVAQLLGLKRSPTERNKYHCPRHGGTSLSLRIGPDRTLQCKCFGCDFAGDVFALIAEVEGLSDFRRVVEVAAELAGVTQSATPYRAATRPRAILEEVPSYPPAHEVAALFDACAIHADGSDIASPYLDESLSAYLQSRAIDPLEASRRGCVYHLPLGVSVPSWAAFGRPWPLSGHRLLCPLFDCRGELRSVRAWRPGNASPKRVAPTGYSTKGLVLADLWGQAMLRGEGDHTRVVIVEGEPDFVTLATGGRLLDERPAIVGVASGAWTQGIAARIADGAEVRIVTDPDAAGETYAAHIAATLAHCCRVLRVRRAADVNDLARQAVAS